MGFGSSRRRIDFARDGEFTRVRRPQRIGVGRSKRNSKYQAPHSIRSDLRPLKYALSRIILIVLAFGKFRDAASQRLPFRHASHIKPLALLLLGTVPAPASRAPEY